LNQGFYNILKGRHLLDGNAYKKWGLIIFCSLLALVMIGSSHMVDSKVHQISRMNEEVKALRSIYVETRAQLMELKMESFVREKMKTDSLYPSQSSPIKILINSSKEKI
tara:strand:- start:427 stop:753 length:327 start_codon:yes stop_codon:yes gene_type:complete